MDKNNDQQLEGDYEGEREEKSTATPQQETIHQHASTYQEGIQPTHQENVQQSSDANENQQKETNSKNKKINFDFDKSLNESKGILKDAIIKPNSVINSNRSISLETSVIIFVLLSIILGIFAYFSVKNLMDNMFGGLGGFLGSSVGIEFLFQTMLGWLITFALGYFSLYYMLSFFGNRKMEHKILLTKYVTVNIPFVFVFCIIFVLFGLLAIEYFMIMYVFGLMLFGMIHIYLFLANVNKPKFDLFWLSAGYLFVLLVATYLLTGIDFGI